MFDIVMPLFNKEAFVAATIESVLAQTYQDWTLFVVDDGSRDGSVAAVRRFSDPRIKLLQQENAGPGVARNTGISAGSAKWIAFLDADDLWLDVHLETLDSVRHRFPGAALIGTAFRYWTGEPPPARMREEPGRERLIRYFRKIADGHIPFYTSSAAFSREAVEQVGPLKPVVVGDETDLWARLALHGPVAIATKPTVLYRVETGGITDSHGPAEGFGRSAPLRLADVSVPVATLADRMAHVADPELRQDISDYIDREVGVALIRAVRLGQIDRARRLDRLFAGPPRGKAGVAAVLAKLPPPLGQRILTFILSVKRATRVSR